MITKMSSKFQTIKYKKIQLPPQKKDYANATPCPADNLPSFREAFPTPDHLDADGCNALAKAILLRAAKDYFDHCDDEDTELVLGENEEVPINQLCTRHMLEQFIDSQLFGEITSIGSKTFKDGIREYKRTHKTFPTVDNDAKANRRDDGEGLGRSKKKGGKGYRVANTMGNFI